MAKRIAIPIDFCWLLIVQTLILATLSVSSSEIKSCATLYTEGNFSQIEFRLQDEGLLTNRFEDDLLSTSGTANSGDRYLAVDQGCILRACNRAHLNGTCKTFESGRYTTQNESFIQEIVSAQCRCDKVSSVNFKTLISFRSHKNYCINN